jgi:hypothetical protein
VKDDIERVSATLPLALVGANTICGPVSISTVQKQLLLDPLLGAGINLMESRSFRPGPFKWVHDKKVMSYTALSPGSARRSQKS